MIHQTVDYLNGLLKAVGVTNNYYGVAELEVVEDRSGNEREVPLVYTSRGNYDEVDFESKSLYHRVTGDVSRDTDEDILTTGCGLGIIEVAPMRLVCFFDRDLYKTDDANIVHKVGMNIANTISSSNIKSLATALQVDYVEVVVTGININKKSIFDEEFIGVEYNLPSDLGLVAVDYEIRVAGDESCFVSYGCNDTPLNITALIVQEYCTGENAGIMIESYITTNSNTQVFTGFEGYLIEDMFISLQGAGNMGYLAGLNAARKMITNWDSLTATATFKDNLPAGYQITVIGTK